MNQSKRKDNFFSIKLGLVISIVLGLSVLLYVFTSSAIETDYYEAIPIATHANGSHFVGSGICIECHLDIYNNYSTTAHYLSSALADSSTIKGSLEKGSNFYFLNDSITIKLTDSNTGVYQEIYREDTSKPLSKSKIDVVIGSGTKGQSYLTWNEDTLFQLQTSYFRPTDVWTISPGMGTALSQKLRSVNAKCLECHTTFAKNTALYGMGNTYDRTKIMYGIDCERCHGPSAQHVTVHKNNPSVQEAKFMIAIDTLTRQKRMDACALCHSGVRSNKKPAFLFLTGDRLEDYSLPSTDAPIQDIDVHGNQDALLRASKCFRETATMDCTTCHNPHENQRNDFTYFNSKCMECHQKNTIVCKEDATARAQFSNNCISCHMPLKPSSSMFVQAGDSSRTAVQVRTHLISIY